VTTAPHILLVEDDPEIRGLVANFLAANGCRASVARDGAEMTRVMSAEPVDLLLLDIMLPGEDGLALCARVRAASNLPIVMLTARTSEDDHVRGLGAGADDYITKPFSTVELLARIRALLRRAHALSPGTPPTRRSVLRFAGWTLDLNARRLMSANGTRVPLTGAEYELLVAFCEHPERVLTREQLVDLTRGRTPAALSRSIDIQVSRLRRKIEADPRDPSLIQTVRAGGYIFTSQVQAP
jgi:two-component system, OmpR family, response regulator